MAYTTVQDLFTGICDSIRTKTGDDDIINHQDIPAKIDSISPLYEIQKLSLETSDLEYLGQDLAEQGYGEFYFNQRGSSSPMSLEGSWATVFIMFKYYDADNQFFSFWAGGNASKGSTVSIATSEPYSGETFNITLSFTTNGYIKIHIDNVPSAYYLGRFTDIVGLVVTYDESFSPKPSLGSV